VGLNCRAIVSPHLYCLDFRRVGLDVDPKRHLATNLVRLK
jgi:hypothetical protein